MITPKIPRHRLIDHSDAGRAFDIVRIEVANDELERALNPTMTAEFARIFKRLGFKFVTLDLEGFRSGSMNALLPAEDLLRAG